MSNELKTDCNHIMGYRHGFYEARLIEADEYEDGFEPSTVFPYCPLCGVKL